MAHELDTPLFHEHFEHGGGVERGVDDVAVKPHFLVVEGQDAPDQYRVANIALHEVGAADRDAVLAACFSGSRLVHHIDVRVFRVGINHWRLTEGLGRLYVNGGG